MAAIHIDTTAAIDDIYNRMGVAYCNRGLYEKALAAFTAALKINPELPEYYSNYAYASAQLKDIVSAEKYYRKAIQLRPDYANANYELAKILVKQSKIDEALRVLEVAVQNGNFSRSDLEEEGEFSAIKDMVKFKALVSKLK